MDNRATRSFVHLHVVLMTYSPLLKGAKLFVTVANGSQIVRDNIIVIGLTILFLSEQYLRVIM